MSTKSFTSVHNIRIRLTSERLDHIISNHPEIREYLWQLEVTLESPEIICEGKNNELIAIRKQKNNYYPVVIYKEEIDKNDGFIITAFITSNIAYYLRKK